MSYTDFNTDNAIGATGEKIFEEDYLKFFDMKYADVSKNPEYRKKDIDYVAAGNKTYEVKTNLKDLENLFIEEYHNIWKEYGKVEFGWFYKTEAKYLVFVNKETRLMVVLKMGKETIDRYNSIKNNYELRKNKVSFNPKNPNDATNKWQGAYRMIKLSEFNGLYSVYQKTIDDTPPVEAEEIIVDDTKASNSPLISAEERETLLNCF